MATQLQVAAHLDLGERRVRSLITAGVLPPASTRGGLDMDACRAAYLRHLRAVAAALTSEDGDLDLIEQRARLASEQADALAMANVELRRELLPREDVEVGMVALASSVAECLGGVPSAAAPLVHAATTISEVEAILRRHINDARTALAAEGERVQAEGHRRSCPS